MAKKRILIVEDEGAIAKPLGMKLGFAGFEPSYAVDGEEALDILSKEKFDLILLDLLMPKIDGFGVLAGMRQMDNHTPVIVATNLSQPEDVARVKELGCDNFYVKSDTTLSQIIDRAKKIMDAPQA